MVNRLSNVVSTSLLSLVLFVGS
ncbi:MAG: hypothetical protein RLZZ232_3903, partial [Planctomycetota bacterium]